SPPAVCPASPAHVRARSAHSGRPARARAAREIPVLLLRTAESAGTRSRALRESTPSPARAVSPSRGRRSPEPPAPASGGRVLAGRGRMSRSCGSQVGKILLHQVKRIRQIACLPDLHSGNRLARFDRGLKGVLQLVGRVVE